MAKCDPKGPLMIHIVKLFNKQDCTAFDAFGRVMSGTLHINDTVKVLGEGYSLEDQEDMVVKDCTTIWVSEAR